MKRFFLIFLLMLTFSFAGEIDILLEKLIKKGVITNEEAKEIKEEIKKEREREEKKEKEKYNFLKNTKFSGDLRVRYQYDDILEGSTDPDRCRGRIRARWGFKTDILENTEVGLRLASGVGEQTSTNQTLEDSFSQKAIWIDRAYVKHKINNFNILAGKIENPFYCSDVIWDSDINPEGIALTFNSKEGFFLNLGYFFLDEFKSNTNDPVIYGFQVGYDSKFKDKNFKIAGGIYITDNLVGKKKSDVSPKYSPKGNSDSGTPDYIYLYEYRPLDFLIEITPFNVINKPFRIYGEYVKNIFSQVPNNDNAWMIGFSIGKLKDKNDWYLEYNYRLIENDATLAILSDSDINGGGTSLKGHKISFSYQISKYSSMGLTYFIGKPLSPRSDRRNTVQLDYLIKF
ncbi:MAG: putative porin [Candidatus Omnitrophica bacterium]|nr:putative porin [Candidatus Omnitrophota bacterium]